MVDEVKVLATSRIIVSNTKQGTRVNAVVLNSSEQDTNPFFGRCCGNGGSNSWLGQLSSYRASIS